MQSSATHVCSPTTFKYNCMHPRTQPRRQWRLLRFVHCCSARPSCTFLVFLLYDTDKHVPFTREDNLKNVHGVLVDTSSASSSHLLSLDPSVCIVRLPRISFFFLFSSAVFPRWIFRGMDSVSDMFFGCGWMGFSFGWQIPYGWLPSWSSSHLFFFSSSSAWMGKWLASTGNVWVCGIGMVGPV